MKKTIITFCIAYIVLPAFSFAQFTTLWTHTNNPSADNDVAYAITADASGIYVAGRDMSPGNSEWRIEKRDLGTGSVIWTQTINPTGGLDEATAITADTSGIYVAGYDNTYNWQSHIEKRDLSTGTLIWTQANFSSSASRMAYAITADASGIYVAGLDYLGGFPNFLWRIEKRDLNTGNVIWIQTNNPSPVSDIAYAITVDTSGIYVTGEDGSGDGQWRIEKRNLSTGNIIWTQTSNPSVNADVAYAITADASGIYVAGSDCSPGAFKAQWRIEKRDLITGSVIWTHTNNPSADSDIPYGITADTSGIYVAGHEGDPSRMRIEKLNPNTGALICTQTSNPNAYSIWAQAITAYAGGIYVAGSDNSNSPGGPDLQWRIEKYDGACITPNISSNNVLCSGTCTGTATVTPTSGTGPYTYSWSNGQTTQGISNLCEGSYTVTVTDSASVSTVYSVFITQPTAMAVTYTLTPASCAACADGSAIATVSGGTPEYAYSWSSGGQTTATATGLLPGSYTICVTDINGCIQCGSLAITFSNGINEALSSDIISIYPNPAHTDVTILFNLTNVCNISVRLLDVRGTEVYHESNLPVRQPGKQSSGEYKSTIDLSKQAKGVYIIYIITDQSTMNRKIVVE